jgi:hypothetical protein
VKVWVTVRLEYDHDEVLGVCTTRDAAVALGEGERSGWVEHSEGHFGLGYLCQEGEFSVKEFALR